LEHGQEHGQGQELGQEQELGQGQGQGQGEGAPKAEVLAKECEEGLGSLGDEDLLKDGDFGAGMDREAMEKDFADAMECADGEPGDDMEVGGAGMGCRDVRPE